MRSNGTGATDRHGLAAVGDALVERDSSSRCAIAHRDGEVLPRNRTSCSFNPQHGPVVEEMGWSPSIGKEREVGVCRADLERLEAGLEPDHRIAQAQITASFDTGAASGKHGGNGGY